MAKKPRPADALGDARSAPPKPDAPELKTAVRRRLRAVQAELGYTQDQMGELVGESRSAWSNWVSELSEIPKPLPMIRLCHALPNWNLTLDWIYLGVRDHLPLRLAIRLRARELGVDPETATPEILERSAA